MVSQRIPTKTELLEALRRSGDEVAAKVAPLDESTLSQGRYENGWNAKQILAHMASIEWAYPRLIDLARAAAAGGAPTPPASQPAPPSAAATAPAGGTPQISNYNERQVEKRAGASKQDLLDEFNKNRATFIAAVEAVDEPLLSQHMTSVGGAEGPLGSVIQLLAVDHVRGHLRDLLGETAS